MTMILTVLAHLCVVLTIVKVDPEARTVVHLHAIMTLIAPIKNATLTPINADWIPTALIGPIVVKIIRAIKGREIVTIILIVKEHFSAALTIVQVDQLEWTAAQVGQ